MAFTKIVSPGIDTTGSYTVQELNTVGVMTAGTVQVGSATTVHTTGIDLGSGNITSHNINSTGIITATSFVGSLTAPLGSVIATDGTFSTNLLALTKIGIGTDDPDSGKSLHVFGDTNDTNVKIEATAAGKDARLELIANSTGVSQIRLGDEASANPGSITYNHSVNSLSFRTNGTSDRLNIISNGNVGIGSTQPGQLLTVGGITGGADGNLSVKTNSSNHAIAIEENDGNENYQLGVNSSGDLGFYNSGATVAAVTFDDNGNVGIGTNDPENYKLHLYGETNSDLRLTATGDDIVNFWANSNRSSADTPIFALKGEWNGTQVANIKFIAGDDTTNKDDGYITFATRESGTGSSSERFRITSGGYVGINETNPIHQLSVGINTSTAWDSNKNISNTTNNDFIGLNIDNINSGANPEVGIMLQAGSSGSGQYTINCLRTGSNTADLIFRTRNGGAASREQLRISSLGRVGIGTTVPDTPLHIRANDAQLITVERIGDLNAGIRFKNSTNSMFAGLTSDADGFAIDDDDDLGSGPMVFVRRSDGHVGINSTIPGSLVDIRGQTAEDAIVNIRSYNKTSAIKLWPSDAHDLDRWRMGFWENNAVTDGNNYPDWMVDGHGRQFQKSNLYLGRLRSFSDGPTSYYPYYGSSGPGIHMYNGRDGNEGENFSAYLKVGIYQSDDDDRNIIYYTHTTVSDTVDSDQHQTFGVTGTGRVQGMHQYYSGRVESDEGSPNSVYVDSNNNGFFSYYGSSYNAYMRSRNTDNTDVCFHLDTGGGPVFKIVSNGNGYFDGVADAGNADYAEYFEWADGNPNNEDRRGYSVIIVPNTNGKIGIATTGDDRSQIMGIVSANPGFVGDSASLNWQGRHLRDEWGSWVTEDQEFLVWNKKGTYTNENGEKVENPQPNINDPNCDPEYSVLVSEIATTPDIPQYALDNNLRITKPSRVTNPDFDPSQIYTPRSDRQEWSAVGLMGKLWLRANQPTGDRWIKLKDGSNGLSYWLVR